MSLEFYKYQGTGNDFVILDNRDGKWDHISEKTISHLCDRRFGIGADGLMLLNTQVSFDFGMKYFNSDGRESSMCGNGGRCLVAFAHKMGIKREEYTFEAIDGVHHAKVLEGGEVRLEMVLPQGMRCIHSETWWIDTGSPHYVQFRTDDWNSWDVYGLGKRVRYSEEFAPSGTNVNFVKELDDHTLAVRTYERGVENETLSCGTGVTAAAYLYLHSKNRESGKIKVQTRGGTLGIEVSGKGTEEEKIYLQGPATFVYKGEIEII